MAKKKVSSAAKAAAKKAEAKKLASDKAEAAKLIADKKASDIAAAKKLAAEKKAAEKEAAKELVTKPANEFAAPPYVLENLKEHKKNGGELTDTEKQILKTNK